jgi:hypothetical protein
MTPRFCSLLAFCMATLEKYNTPQRTFDAAMAF